MSDATENVGKRITVFLLITMALSAIFYVLIGAAGTVEGGGSLYVLGMMWSPGVAAIVTRLLFQGNLRGMGWRWGRTRYQLWSYLLPFLLALVAYVPVWLTGLGGFYDQTFVAQMAGRFGLPPSQPALVILVALLYAGTVGMVGSLVSALGEEIGWRGFLVPELAKTNNFARTSLISGIIWAVWHYPGIILGIYSSGAPAWYVLMAYTVFILGFSFLLAWFRFKSGSVWTAMFLHASYNLFVQAIFTPLTVDTGPTAYFITEFGAAMAVVYAIVGYVVWRRRGALLDNAQPLSE